MILRVDVTELNLNMKDLLNKNKTFIFSNVSHLDIGVISMIGMTEILIILVIILILFGPKKLPELARSIGESVKSYREGMAGKKKPKLKG